MVVAPVHHPTRQRRVYDRLIIIPMVVASIFVLLFAMVFNLQLFYEYNLANTIERLDSLREPVQ